MPQPGFQVLARTSSVLSWGFLAGFCRAEESEPKFIAEES